jgi:RecA/RadA recombinase
MAKKQVSKSSNSFSFTEVGDLIKDISKTIPIVIADENENNNRELIGTGIYILNASLSGSLFGGIQSNRITSIAGPSGSGKSFICYGIVKEAQQSGWNTIYIDTEFSIERDQLPGYGIDINPEIFTLIRANVVEDVIKLLAQVMEKYKEVKRSGGEIPKTMIILDSVGLMCSRKESEDAKDGAEKVDMSRAKKLASMFRIINGDLGYLNIPMICTNHVYEELSMFPKVIMKGGCLVGGVNILMADGSYKQIQDIKVGDFVQTLENQQEVKETYVYDDKVLYEVEFEDGTIIKCSENHRFLISEDFDNDSSWVEIKDFNKFNINDIYIK